MGLAVFILLWRIFGKSMEENKRLMNQINIEVKVDTRDLYEFLMYNNYCSFKGIVSILFSVMAIVGTILYWKDFSTFYKIFMIVLSLLFTVIVPIEYYIRAKRQESKGFKEAFYFVFDENGIGISKGEEHSELKWNEVMKVVSTKNLVVIFFTPVRAFILPKRCLQEKFDELKNIMEEFTSCYKFKMEK